MRKSAYFFTGIAILFTFPAVHASSSYEIPERPGVRIVYNGAFEHVETWVDGNMVNPGRNLQDVIRHLTGVLKSLRYELGQLQVPTQARQAEWFGDRGKSMAEILISMLGEHNRIQSLGYYNFRIVERAGDGFYTNDRLQSYYSRQLLEVHRLLEKPLVQPDGPGIFPSLEATVKDGKIRKSFWRRMEEHFGTDLHAIGISEKDRLKWLSTVIQIASGERSAVDASGCEIALTVNR
jgi:hypothetical protein